MQELKPIGQSALALPSKTHKNQSWGFFPVLTILVLIGPIVSGLVGTILPAFGGSFQSGLSALSFEYWGHLIETPGLARSAWLSLKTGLISTFVSLLVCLLLVASWQGTKIFLFFERLLSPLLSVPHAAAALGLTFLIAPSGWVFRLISPWATGLQRPADLLILGDPDGWALSAGLIIKEMPFLLLMSLAALSQVDTASRMRIALSLGYGQVRGWMLCVLPALYRQIRLPVYAVIVYSMSNVDVSMILGPTAPPTLSIYILNWMTDHDLALRNVAAAGAILQLALVLIGLLIWRLGEKLCALWTQRAISSGKRGAGQSDVIFRLLALIFAAASLLAIFGGLLSQVIWSFAGRWRFPEALPSSFTTRIWERHGASALEMSMTTLALALLAALIALILTIGCLEAEFRRGRVMQRAGLILIYLPLLVPQIAFLPGLQILLLQIGAGLGFWPVLMSHVVFVLPYVFLALSGPYRAWDHRFHTLATAMGKSAFVVLWRLRLPMLLAPILTAMAVGMAVSVGQFLPTLLASGGRLATLTTEAIALSSGGDRRVIGAWVLILSVAAWLPFSIALFVPRFIYRKRLGMLHE